MTDEEIRAVLNLIAEDGHIRVSKIAETVLIPVGSAQSILHQDLQMSKVVAKWVPQTLNPLDRQHRFAT